MPTCMPAIGNAAAFYPFRATTATRTSSPILLATVARLYCLSPTAARAPRRGTAPHLYTLSRSTFTLAVLRRDVPYDDVCDTSPLSLYLFHPLACSNIPLTNIAAVTAAPHLNVTSRITAINRVFTNKTPPHMTGNRTRNLGQDRAGYQRFCAFRLRYAFLVLRALPPLSLNDSSVNIAIFNRIWTRNRQPPNPTLSRISQHRL